MAKFRLFAGLILIAEIFILIVYSKEVEKDEEKKKERVIIVNDALNVDYVNPKYADLHSSVDDGKITVAIEVKEKFNPEYTANVEAFSWNGKRYIPVRIPGAGAKQPFCNFIKKEKLYIPYLVKHFNPNPEECPPPIGTWNLTGYTPDENTVPQVLPTGQYKVRLTFGHETETYYTLIWLGKVALKKLEEHPAAA